MLEVYSVRRSWDREQDKQWYILYRTKPGMWEGIMITAPSEQPAIDRLASIYDIVTVEWTGNQ